MENSEKFFPRTFKERVKEYYYDNRVSLFVNSSFAVIVLVIVALLLFIVIPGKQKKEISSKQTIVKVYLTDNDTVVSLLKSELDGIRTILHAMRNDSFTVEISKVKRK